MLPAGDELILQCARGERRAQLELYRQLYSLLMGTCRRYYRNKEDCEQQVNTAFLKILNSLKTYGHQSSFESWCRRIITNTIIDDFRKNKKRLSIMQAESPDHSEQLDAASYNMAEANLAAEDLEQLLHKLPDATRYVFNLFSIEGYTHSEIAATAGISESTSKWHVAEARKRLRTMIEETLKGGQEKK